jgi:hypothetical protein
VNHALNIVAGVMTVIGHAAPAAAGPDPLATDAAAAAACFEVDMAGLSAQPDPTGPFDGIAVTRIDDELLLVDLTDPAGGRASWIVEGELCFGEQP